MEINKKTIDKTQSLRKVLMYMKRGEEVVVPQNLHSVQQVRVTASKLNSSTERKYQVSCRDRIDDTIVTRIK